MTALLSCGDMKELIMPVIRIAICRGDIVYYQADYEFCMHSMAFLYAISVSYAKVQNTEQMN